MSKQISNIELATIVNQLLTDASDQHIEDAGVFCQFMTKVAEAVAEVCGGEVTHPANEVEPGAWYIPIVANESLPDDGGIWAHCDPGGNLFHVQELDAAVPINALSKSIICQHPASRCKASIPAPLKVPDGYNGHTVLLSTEIVEQNSESVKLSVYNSTYLMRWVSRDYYQNHLKGHGTTIEAKGCLRLHQSSQTQSKLTG